jgi:hypothetical protein
MHSFTTHPVQLALIAAGQPLVREDRSGGNVQLRRHVVLPEVGAAAQR